MPASTFHAPVGDVPVVDPYDLGRDGLVELVTALDQPAYRASQLYSWLVRGVDDPQRMTDLPTELRERLAARFSPARPQLIGHRVADDGATHKLLLEFPGVDRQPDSGQTTIETVVMLYPGSGQQSPRATVCVSTQAGCAMGCPFCATGQAGLSRQLTTGEVVRQVVVADAFVRSRRLGDALQPVARDRSGSWSGGESWPDHLTNVVYMGMGEPLANLEATLASLRWICDPDGFDLSARNVTVSTIGLVPGVRRLAELDLPVTLAVSLHAPDNDLRDELVPVNRVHPLGALLDAVGEWRSTIGRRVSFEYVLIEDVNDRPDQARALGRLVRDADRPDPRPRSHVNLIPLNPTPGVPEWNEPAPDRIRAFADQLRAAGVPTTVRDTRGRDAQAACGQLVATYRLGQGRQLPVAAGAAERVDALRQVTAPAAGGTSGRAQRSGGTAR